MINFGAVPAGAVLPVFFNSYDANGASVTLTGLAVTDIEIYKGTSITQRASDAGYALIDTDGIDVDGVTGLHAFSIDTGDNTDSGFYSVGSFFTVVVSAVTIASQTVSFIAATFRLVAAEGVTGKPKVDVDAWLGTAAATPAVAGRPSVDAIAISGSTTAADNAEVVFATDFATNYDTTLDRWQVDVDTVSGDATAAETLELFVEALDQSTGQIDAGSFAAGAIDAAAIANGAIDAATFAADVDAEILSYIVDDATRIDASALNTATGTTIPAIVADTNELQTDWTNGGRLDLIVDAILDDTDLIDDGTSGLAKIATDVAAILVDTGTTLDGKVDAIKAKTDSLTFTIANQVDSNIKSVAGTTVTGTGTGADPWGP